MCSEMLRTERIDVYYIIQAKYIYAVFNNKGFFSNYAKKIFNMGVIRA
jgi:hypothetical protein